MLPNLHSTLESTQFLALSTFDNDETWTCPVFFAYENNLTLYAISQPSYRHMHNLKKNPKVSVVIYSTAQNPLEGVQGTQMQATAKIVPDDEVEEAFEIYYKRSPRDVVENAIEPAFLANLREKD